MNDNVNDENIDKSMNTPGQDSNLSSHRRHICVYEPAERCRSFIQHVNIQAKSKNKNILTDKKIEKLFLYQMHL